MRISTLQVPRPAVPTSGGNEASTPFQPGNTKTPYSANLYFCESQVLTAKYIAFCLLRTAKAVTCPIPKRGPSGPKPGPEDTVFSG